MCREIYICTVVDFFLLYYSITIPSFQSKVLSIIVSTHVGKSACSGSKAGWGGAPRPGQLAGYGLRDIYWEYAGGSGIRKAASRFGRRRVFMPGYPGWRGAVFDFSSLSGFSGASE